MNEQAAIAVSATPIDSASDKAPALCFVGTGHIRLWGLTGTERLSRGFARQGITRVIDATELADFEGPVIILRGDAVLDAPLISVLIDRQDLLLMSSDPSHETPVACHTCGPAAVTAMQILLGEHDDAASAGLTALRPDDLDASYWKSLRKREVPYALIVTADNSKAVEWRMFMGTYKGATDFITKHFWPVPAFTVTRIIAPLGISPNMVTSVSAVCVVAAYFFFLSGQWLPGIACAWMMTFLDTVDGKLARVTLTSSKWGDVFDHGIDLIHPPFWYTAWAVGVMASFTPLPTEQFWPVLSVILIGYLLQRIMEGISIRFLGLEIHIWRRIDTLFRQITARRNPNLALLTVFAAFGRPDWGLVAVAAWTLLCLILHTLQLLHAGYVARRHGPLESWLIQSPGPK